MSEKLTRQQIYDRIRATSKDSYILEEMQRLGFWENNAIPSLSEVLIQRETDITQELNKLMAQERKFSNQEAMLKEMRKERMKRAKEKRELTKQKNKQKRIDKANAWEQTQLEQIIYLGKGVSAGLNNTDSDIELLQKNNLPVFRNVTELAQSMQIDLQSLRYLLFHRNVSTTTHYHTFELPKKSGGKRKIAAPKKQLKRLQRWVLESILNGIAFNDTAHGFIKQRSIVTNALPHLKKDIVVNIDLKDFFPTISFKRVKGLFNKLGYSEQLATIFALLCTQSNTEQVTLDDVNYYVHNGERFLPQGSPASPAISNLIAYKLDKKIQGLATKLNFTYTRYADDLTFSTSKDNEVNVSRLLYFIKKIVEAEGFTMHPDKTHVMRKGGRQQVTGIVVNEKLNVNRDKLRKFRALLHNVEINGWQNQQWGKAKHLINSIEGYIQFVQMVNPDRAVLYKNKLQQIIARHGYPAIEITVPDWRKQQQQIPQPPTEAAIIKQPAPEKQTDWWNILS